MRSKSIFLVLSVLLLGSLLAFTGCNQGGSRGASGEAVTITVTPKPLPVQPQYGTSDWYPQPATSYTTNPKYPRQPAISNVNGFPITQEKTVMKVGTPTNTGVLDYVNNDVVIYQEALTNIKIDFELLPSSNHMDRVNIMFASGEKLPDIFANCGFNASSLVTLGSGRMLIPLADLIQAHAPNTQKMFNEKPMVRPMITSADGNIYAFPHYDSNEANQAASRFWINRVFRETLGMQVPKTTEDLYNFLVAVRDRDPNRNGLRDEIPLMGNTNGWESYIEAFIMMAFTFSDRGGTNARRMFMTNDGKIAVSYTTPEWRQGLEYFARLGREGLLASESFTFTSTEHREIVEHAAAPILGATPGGTPPGLTTGTRRTQWEALAPLIGPSGRQKSYYSQFRPILVGRIVITKDCEIPEIAVKWQDYNYTPDMWTRNRFGTLGKDWKIPPAGTIAVDGGPALYEEVLLWGQEQSSYWAPDALSWSAFNSYNRAFTGDIYELEYVLWNTKLVFDQYRDTSLAPTSMPFTVEEAREHNSLNEAISQFVDQKLAAVATNREQITDAWWSSYLRELERLGLPRLLEVNQSAFDRVWAQALGFRR